MAFRLRARRLAAIVGSVLLPLAAASRSASATAAPATGTTAPATAPLQVSAAVSVGEPLRQLADRFARARRLPPPRLNLAASGVLAQQILAGAPAEVFLSAGARPLERLERAGLLLAGTRRDLFGNRLVLVVPARAPVRPLRFSTLAAPWVRRIAIGDPTVPAGDYARQVLQASGVAAAVQARLVPLGSVRAVARAVADGNVDAGIVYRSDLLGVPGLRLVATAPERSHAPIRYSAAVLAPAGRPALAREFLAYLATPEAQAVWRRHGFLPLAATRRR